MKVTKSVDLWLHLILTLKLDGDEWSASRPGGFSTGKEPRNPLKGSWMGPRAGLASSVTTYVNVWHMKVSAQKEETHEES
jgi:hypothetical protein